MTYTVTLIPGDGIGPEVASAAVRVLTATGVGFDFETHSAGAEAMGLEGVALPARVLDSIRKNKLALKGPTGTPIGSGHRSVNVELRTTLDLYANVRPVRTLPGVKSRYDNVDLVIFRENTEDLYSGLEHVVVPGVVESIKIITEKASTRIARYAFAYARSHGRKRITAVHKANIMKVSDGLFLDCCRKVAAEHRDITYDELIVDNCCMQLVLDPTRFDCLLLPNLYGDIVSDLCAGFIGGLFGIGGGVVIVPALYAVFSALGVEESVRMHVAVGTSLSTTTTWPALARRRARGTDRASGGYCGASASAHLRWNVSRLRTWCSLSPLPSSVPCDAPSTCTTIASGADSRTEGARVP